MDDQRALELIRHYFDEASTLYACARLLFAGRAGDGYIVALANPCASGVRAEEGEDPATMIEVSEEAVASAERVLNALRRDQPELAHVRISLVFDDPQDPDVFPGDFSPR
ncbi:MAG: hypothetical protein H6740_20045 [Alphaproteobacteria bacterium]|nr:hypothetical protein [Alphaproteobacteria bacterium]